jgi:hypothetical protein
MRIYPEAIWSNGHRWLTFLLAISLSLSPLHFPNVPLCDPPMIITPVRFRKKKRALLVCKCLRGYWRCTSLDMAETDIHRFLLVHGYRQKILGESSIWFEHTSANMLLSNYSFNPNMRDLPFRFL